MPEETTGAVEAPDAGAEAPAESPDTDATAPTPVREGAPEGPATTADDQEPGYRKGKSGLSEIAERVKAAREEEAEAAEPREPGDGVPTPPAEREVDGTPEGTYRETSTGRLKDSRSHRYLEEPTAEGEPQEAEEAAQPAAEAEAEEAEAQTPDDDVPEGYERVELSEGHPLRARGKTHVTLPGPDVVGQEDYEALRSGLNNPTRNREVEEARREAFEARRQIAEMEARQEILQSEDYRKLDPEQNPDLKQQLDDHRETYGEESAKLIEESLAARREALTEDRVSEARSEAELEAAAQTFIQQVGQHAERAFPVWAEHGELRDNLTRLITRYSQFVDEGLARPDPRQFFQWAGQFYQSDPRVGSESETAARQNGGPEKSREELKEEIRQEVLDELKAEEAERLKESAERRSRTRTGPSPSADVGVRSTPRSGATPEERAQMGPDQVKKAGKQRLLDRFLS